MLPLIQHVDQLTEEIEGYDRRSKRQPLRARTAGAARGRPATRPARKRTICRRSISAKLENNAAIAKSLFLTERAVEKHINSVFHKLDLTEEPDVHRRVMAVLAFLRDQS